MQNNRISRDKELVNERIKSINNHYKQSIDIKVNDLLEYTKPEGTEIVIIIT